MNFNIITLGCKVNIYETEMIKESFFNHGYKISDENPGVIIINTCSITNIADIKSKKIIRRMKREHPESILIVVGCTAQNHQESLNNLDIDILIGTKDKSKLIDILNEYKKSKKKYVKFYDISKSEFEDMSVSKFTNHTRCFIKIQDGCNNFCSYCIIPYLRGRNRFKDFNKVLEEAKGLVRSGHKEIVLIGIHTGSYPHLVKLIDEMSKIEKLERIRISSIEITEIDEKFLNMLKNNPKVCNHLHIPLQSGSDKILKLMNRKYDKKYFENVINKLRSIKPDISITTDVIVGFPSESENDFNECVEFCKKLNFSKIHVFPYSIRSGTIAANIKEQLESKIKKERSRVLSKISDELEEKYYKKFINSEVDILTEEIDGKVSIGHTSNYLKVVVNEILDHNEIYKVKIIDIRRTKAIGKKINN